MKETAVKKINRMGHAGVVLTTICKILVGLCGLGIIILAITLFRIPNSLLSITTYSNVDIQVDPSGTEFQQTEEETHTMIQTIKNLLDSGTFTITDATGTTVNLDPASVEERTGSGNATYLMFHNNSEPNTFTVHRLAWFLSTALLYLVMTMVSLFFAGSLCNAFRYCDSPFESGITHKMSMFAYSLIPWVFLSSIVNSIANFLLTGNIQFAIRINIGMIFIILVIFGLVFIFKYGAILQQESDETL